MATNCMLDASDDDVPMQLALLQLELKKDFLFFRSDLAVQACNLLHGSTRLHEEH